MGQLFGLANVGEREKRRSVAEWEVGEETRKPIKPKKVCGLPWRFVFGSPSDRNLGNGGFVHSSGGSAYTVRSQRLGRSVGLAIADRAGSTVALVGVLD